MSLYVGEYGLIVIGVYRIRVSMSVSLKKVRKLFHLRCMALSFISDHSLIYGDDRMDYLIDGLSYVLNKRAVALVHRFVYGNNIFLGRLDTVAQLVVKFLKLLPSQLLLDERIQVLLCLIFMLLL